MNRNIVKIADLTQEMVRARLDYDPITGIFKWKEKPCNPIQIGDVAGHKRPDGYVNIRLFYRFYAAHRLAWFYTYGVWPALLDHKDGDTSNNALSNLRLATVTQNQHNRIVDKGYTWNRSYKRFYARITVNGTRIFLGGFHTAEAARSAYLEAHQKYIGEFSFLNREVEIA